MSRTARSNSQIVDFAIKGIDAVTSSGNFSTDANPNGWNISSNWLTGRMSENLRTLASAGRISQVIKSYATVIAFKLDGVWVRIDDKHSITTSTKHESQLYRLPGAVWCPRDASLEELFRITQGLMRYERGYGNNVGTYKAA